MKKTKYRLDHYKLDAVVRFSIRTFIIELFTELYLHFFQYYFYQSVLSMSRERRKPNYNAYFGTQ